MILDAKGSSKKGQVKTQFLCSQLIKFSMLLKQPTLALAMAAEIEW